MSDAPVQYTPEEIKLIKEMILKADAAAAVCPRCNRRLSEKIIGGGGTVSAVSEHTCPGCGATVTMADVMK